MTGVAALALCAGFTACSHDDFTFSEEEYVQNQKEMVYAQYQQAFINAFGEPAKNHTWGFQMPTATTRSITINGDTYDSFTFRLLSMRTRPSWICSLKKSFAEQPARPEDAQAQAHAQEDAQAQEETQAQLDAQDEWCEEPLERCEFPEEPEERGRLTGTLITLT